jgi:serine/threonine protein kinase/Tfp pilus assembly protein PilF
MQPATSETSTCPACGRALEETSGGGLGCVVCLFRVGIGSEDDVSQDQAALESDEHFGIYEIDRREDGGPYELGHGAMGATYRATDTTLQRKVALKIVRLAGAGPSHDARERFLREARAAATLRHQNIATVFQFGISEETGQLFYAMELVEGETLEERVRRTGPLDVRTTIAIAQQVTAALIAAENCGVIHRDLKPANLMLVDADESGLVGRDQACPERSRMGARRGVRAAQRDVPTVKIIDFGLAKALHAPADPTHRTHHGFVGTPAFASPEQFENSALDVRSDIYSLGATLWFALTGKTPFAGRSVEEIHHAQKSNALPLEQLKATHVPHRLRSLLKSMLAIEPAARPGTRELAAQLQRCADQVSGARRKRVALAAAAVLILGTAALSIFESWQTGHRPVATALTPSIPEKSVAVLPFENLSRDPDNTYLAEGIQEEILTRLAKIADLKVISRTSTQQYQSKPANLAEIAKQLGVANILEGSVQKAADQLRVNVQLIKAQTDSHLWADTYDRKLTDVFGVESEIAKGIAESLQAKLTGREEQALAVKPTNNPEAYDAYLRGLAFEARTIYQTDLRREAIGFYERAVQLDPNFALAWARLSRAQARLYTDHADTTPPTRRDAAKSALENAQRLEPNSPETLLALGYYQYWVLGDYGLAKTTFKELSKLLPGNSEIPAALGHITQSGGHVDESIAYFEQGLALDPRNMDLLFGAAVTYAMLRQFPVAIKLYDRALDVIPNDPELMALKATMYQAEGNLQESAKLLIDVNERTTSGTAFGTKLGQLRLERNHAEAIRLLQARRAQVPSAFDSVDLLHLAFAQRFVGDTAGAKVTAEQARNTLEPLCKEQPDNPDLEVQLALADAVLGKRDSALREAERTIMAARIYPPVGRTADDGASEDGGIERRKALALDDNLLSASNDLVYGGTGYEEILAVIQTVFGENSRAISTLTRLLKATYDITGPASVTPALLRLDPLWDPLRADPAFQKLCEEKQP